MQLQTQLECGVRGVNVRPNVVEDLGTAYVIAKVIHPAVKQKNNL